MQLLTGPHFRQISFGTLLLLFTALILLAGNHFLVEFWWHSALDMSLYYLMRLAYRDCIIVAVTLIQGGFIFINFILIPILLEVEPGQLFVQSRWRNRLSQLMLRPSGKLFLISAIVFTIPILTPLYLHWEAFLLFFFNAGSSMQDPVFGQDIAFYLFSYPFIQLLQTEMLVVFLLLFATIALTYWLIHRHANTSAHPLQRGVKLHLTGLILIIVAIQAWAISMERFSILYVDRHEPIYFGPGFVETNFQLPLIWLNYLFFLVAAFAAIAYIYRRRGLRIMTVCALIYLSMLVVKQTEWLPGLIDRFYVAPNPVTSEHNNIGYNITATLKAFDLEKVEPIDYNVKPKTSPVDKEALSKVLKYIPLWDQDLLLSGYDQMQAIRPYFDFYDVAVDRYRIQGQNFQVNVAARELNFNKVPTSAKTWNNRHFVYTHGYGLVMTPSLQEGQRPMEWLIRDLSNQTSYDQLQIKRPEIFYGLGNYDYAVVPNDAQSTASSDQDVSFRNDLPIEGDIAISSLLRRIVLASYFNDFDLLMTTNMTRSSRLLMRRNIIDRVTKLAPFLTIDNNPYPVIVDHKIFWIVDAYTTSDQFPGVRPYTFPLDGGEHVKSVNYIRNSVKIIVDAFNGNVDLYQIDADDPIVNTYSTIYPTLFKKLEQIPKAFINHLSYPKRLFEIQMQVYARYHQTDPSLYYQQSETMSFPEIEGEKVLPYFLTLSLENGYDSAATKDYKFLLLAPLNQIGRDNLRMIAMAGCIKPADCQKAYSADILAYRFPKDQQIEGPAQIDGLIDQNPDISRQFTLWQRRGTTIDKGRIIIVPVAGSMLYIQPIYTRAKSSTGFPQLSRIIVALNKVTAMDRSIEQAFNQVITKLENGDS